MEENKALQDFIKRVKEADLDQLIAMKSTIRNFNLFITIFAMTMLLLTLHYPSVLMLIITPIAVLISAVISTSFDNGIKIINERIMKLTDK